LPVRTPRSARAGAPQSETAARKCGAGPGAAVAEDFFAGGVQSRAADAS
jgi:hypothetical protein